MGKIKSALELAMEKTEGMAIDREKLKQKDLKKKGQILASSIISGTEKEGEAKLKSYSGDDLHYIKEGICECIISFIRLPVYLNSDNRLGILEKTFSLVSDKNEIISQLFNQLRQLFEQYIGDITNLTEGLKQQYMPILMQKQQQMMQQTGQNIQIEPEQDPDFMELLSKNRTELEDQYNKVIAQTKEELKKIL